MKKKLQTIKKEIKLRLNTFKYLFIFSLRYFWFFLLAFITCFISSSFFTIAFDLNKNYVIRIFGYLLQLIGIYFISKGLYQLWLQFDKPTISKMLINWIKVFPRLIKRPPPVQVHGSSHLSFSGKLEAELINKNNDRTLEERMIYLEEKTKKLEDDFRNFKDASTKYREETKKEIKELAEDGSKIKNKIQNVSLEGMGLEFLGLSLITVGIFFTTFPDGIQSIIPYYSFKDLLVNNFIVNFVLQ